MNKIQWVVLAHACYVKPQQLQVLYPLSYMLIVTEKAAKLKICFYFFFEECKKC